MARKPKTHVELIEAEAIRWVEDQTMFTEHGGDLCERLGLAELSSAYRALNAALVAHGQAMIAARVAEAQASEDELNRLRAAADAA